MSHPIDVGSVLGGRYKVTATVLTSHDQDLVLDGVDQVLNRPVSILVAGPDNTEQVAQSAREVATGERPGNVQVLDLGVTEAATYLITNHTSAADLLDLVVASHAPYVEPFFTDTLGSEIFGQARSHEPEPYDDEENIDAGYINYADNHPSQVDPFRSAAPVVPPLVPPVVPARPPVRPAVRPASGSAKAGAAGAGAAAATAAHQHVTAPQPMQAAENRSVPGPAEPRTGAGSDTPKVSLWSEDDYSTSPQDAGYDEAVGSGTPERSDRAAREFPSLARKVSPAAAIPPSGGTDDYYDDEEPEREPRSMRWLVGGLLAVVLIAGLVFAVTNLGSLFKTGPQAAPSSNSTGSTQPNTGSASPNQSSAPPAAPPAIDNITRQGNFDFAATYDVDLVKAFDGNAASYWSDMEFATEGWGGLANDGVPLFVKLKNPATVSSITLTQLGASGGNLSVFTNDRPSLDGAKLVGTNSFTSTDLTMPLAAPVEAQYVIVSIKALPKLAAPKTRYGFGIRLAEIKIQ
ncbi:ABC transporter substrate-binding protein [Arthrobacter sp. AQ5-06]|nr:ABC transporter substrate-binding protein [Arthrobacter sp. AQ5-06]